MNDTSSAIQAAMLNDSQRLTIISQNIANAATGGYKRQIPVSRSFSDYMTLYAGNQQKPSEIHVSLPYMTSSTDPSMGALNYTGNPFDVVADSNAYFVVRTPSGIAYTKQGSFQINSQGTLVNQLGYPVQGKSGNISLSTTKPKINQDGKISEHGNTVNQLDIVTFKPGTQLQDIGYGLYNVADKSAIDTNATPKVQQGYVEKSNVVIMDEMVRMIETMRHFEASQHFMQGYDDMLDKSINVIGDI